MFACIPTSHLRTYVNIYPHTCVLIFSLALPVLIRPPPHLASYDPSTSHVTSPLPHMTPPLLMSLLHCLIRTFHFSCHFSTVSFTLAAHHTQAGRPSCSSKDQSLQLLLQERLQVPLQRTYPTTAEGSAASGKSAGVQEVRRWGLVAQKEGVCIHMYIRMYVVWQPL